MFRIDDSLKFRSMSDVLNKYVFFFNLGIYTCSFGVQYQLYIRTFRFVEDNMFGNFTDTKWFLRTIVKL